MKFITQGPYYVWLPVITALGWFTTLFGLLLLRATSDHRKTDRSNEATVPFISDIGAAHMTWFSSGCTTVAVFYIMTVVTEGWLKYHQRIPQLTRKWARYWGYSTIINGILAAAWMVTQSVISKFKHPDIHWQFTTMFITFISFSGLSQLIEAFYLQKDYPDRAFLRRGALIKVSIVPICIILGWMVGILFFASESEMSPGQRDALLSTSAVCEWVVCFLLTLYFLTFAFDFWQVTKTSSTCHVRIMSSITLQGEEPYDSDVKLATLNSRDTV
ncbi:hypothetical protein PCANC_20910 [Puccinia coronata f. sp. avenae]|uniref:CWH43-like N-terminal domain-containing protein n=1 Tax=Puccinia coronata f. sp. avenae TaxID=200324 RepID=A0A2N5V1T3_9BASI|nr:hypothetical protein PCANC_20910 [Puccinia coronata f. sp. avenae]PLW43960.1 hypothetical protein PCASD_06510 [Puccinia coronata f. sp. avenae]